MPNISPFLRYRDANAAIDWLCTAFGFELINCYPDERGGVAHAELRAGDGIIQVSTARNGDGYGRSPLDLNGLPGGIYMVVDDPDAHFARAKAANAGILMEPTDEDYGGRDYACRDIEGHVWSFGTYVPGAPQK